MLISPKWMPSRWVFEQIPGYCGLAQLVSQMDHHSTVERGSCHLSNSVVAALMWMFILQYAQAQEVFRGTKPKIQITQYFSCTAPSAGMVRFRLNHAFSMTQHPMWGIQDFKFLPKWGIWGNPSNLHFSIHMLSVGLCVGLYVCVCNKDS